MYKVSSEDYD
jgi:hypothetical protein